MFNVMKKYQQVNKPLLSLVVTFFIILFSTSVFASPSPPQVWPGCYSLKDGVLKVNWDTNWGEKANTAELYNKETKKVIASLTSDQIFDKTQTPGEGCNGEFLVNGIKEDHITFYVTLNHNDSIRSEDVTVEATGGKKKNLDFHCGYDTENLPSITRELIVTTDKGIPIPCSLKITTEPSAGSLQVKDNEFTYIPKDNSSIEDSFSYQAMRKSDGEVLKEGKISITYKHFKPMKNLKYYREHINDFKASDTASNSWLNYWAKSGVPGTTGKDFSPKLATLKYYIKIKNIDLSKIKEEKSSDNPDNVNRIIKLMPKSQFEKVFPYTARPNEVRNGFIPGKTFTYLNFLKAAAVMPGYCGDYKDYPNRKKTSLMNNDPDKIAKRLLATTFAHAVQETSDTGPNAYDLNTKIPGTFGHVRESGQPGRYLDAGGPFGSQGYLYYLTEGNSYFGRGAKQLSYPSNYANTSLLLYGDLRLVKYPQLVEEQNLLPFLTAITYALIPKSGNPSLAEVMDGSWSKKLNQSKAPNEFKKIYDRDFPLTVLLVNGGPECDGHTDQDSVDRSKYRIDAYNKFSTDGNLLDDKVIYPVEDKSTNLNYYKVDQLKPSKINNGETDYQSLFRRPYYYSKDGVVEWDSGIQIFGGKAVRDQILTCDLPSSEGNRE
ncbi:MAG: hypothetical protein A2X47_01000 [Lentisphaerae bacterium GWF2_38_69]|nr:MAG: hypothetical protein A2X47_01000 [Lentisphaerae bacterium GWF2_38_69]